MDVWDVRMYGCLGVWMFYGDGSWSRDIPIDKEQTRKENLNKK